MKKRLGDWSLNLEDEYYAEHPDEMLKEAVQAVTETMQGHYVNVVVHENAGDPRDGFMDLVAEELRRQAITVSSMVYIDQCGCGGYVFRISR